VARGTGTGVEINLGFVPEDDLEDGCGILAGVALPDGEYAIEARPSSFFWPDARPDMAPIYRLQAGEPPEAQLLAVVNLTASISTDYWRMLEWSVQGDAGESDYALGVWFGEDAPLAAR